MITNHSICYPACAPGSLLHFLGDDRKVTRILGAEDKVNLVRDRETLVFAAHKVLKDSNGRRGLQQQEQGKPACLAPSPGICRDGALTKKHGRPDRCQCKVSFR